MKKFNSIFILFKTKNNIQFLSDKTLFEDNRDNIQFLSDKTLFEDNRDNIQFLSD